MDWMAPETEFPKKSWAAWAALIVLALLVHAILYEVPQKYFLPAPDTTASSPPIELSRVPEKYADKSQKPVVETSKAKEQEDTGQDPRFAGEFRNRVKKETQSPRSGRFQPQQKGGSPLPQSKEGDMAPGTKLSDLMPFATTPNGLPKDIAPGGETVLNTEPVRYASFMNRIADEIYNPWVRHVREALAQRNKLDATSYSTVLEIEMNAKGEVTGITVVRKSGIPELDNAPKTAFWERQPFPNPPVQLMKPDGFIRFNYQFTVESGRSMFNILPQEM